MNSGPQKITAHRLYHRLGFERLYERETRVLDDGTRLFAFGYDLAPFTVATSTSTAPSVHLTAKA